MNEKKRKRESKDVVNVGKCNQHVNMNEMQRKT